MPAIGRLRPQPFWDNKGPRVAAGLIVSSHGYMSGRDGTNQAPQGRVANVTRQGYDLYRFDREWIRDWAGDATRLAEAVRQARAMAAAGSCWPASRSVPGCRWPRPSAARRWTA